MNEGARARVSVAACGHRPTVAVGVLLPVPWSASLNLRFHTADVPAVARTAMHHATTSHTDSFRAMVMPAMAQDDDALAAVHIDEDWEEFLSLGLQLDSAHLGAAAGDWQRAPVLLSY